MTSVRRCATTVDVPVVVTRTLSESSIVMDNDFTVSLGFDEHGAASVVCWMCRKCDGGMWSKPADAVEAMASHARTHIPASVASR